MRTAAERCPFQPSRPANKVHSQGKETGGTLMKIELAVGDIRKHRADMIVVNLFEGTKSPGGSTGAVDKAIGGALSAAIREGAFQGEWGETLFLRPEKGVASPRVLVGGLGEEEEVTPYRVRLV